MSWRTEWNGSKKKSLKKFDKEMIEIRNRKVIGIVLLAGGIVAAAVALAANQLGMDVTSVFGFKQSLGVLMGADRRLGVKNGQQ